MVLTRSLVSRSLNLFKGMIADVKELKGADKL